MNVKRPVLAVITAVWLLTLTNASAFYDPGAQRWINRDPIQERGGVNLSAYVENQPLALSDPYGLDVRRGWDCVREKQEDDAKRAPLNLGKMANLAREALKEVGSEKWQDFGQFGKYGPGVNKCNLFWASKAGDCNMMVPGMSGFLSRNPPMARQIADTNLHIPYWPVISGPVPGACMSSGGHVGIVGPDTNSSISVYNGLFITNNNWGFRPGQMIIFRGYNGP